MARLGSALAPPTNVPGHLRPGAPASGSGEIFDNSLVVASVKAVFVTSTCFDGNLGALAYVRTGTSPDGSVDSGGAPYLCVS